MNKTPIQPVLNRCFVLRNILYRWRVLGRYDKYGNGISLILLINFKKNRIETIAKINAVINPAMKNGRASIESTSIFKQGNKASSGHNWYGHDKCKVRSSSVAPYQVAPHRKWLNQTGKSQAIM